MRFSNVCDEMNVTGCSEQHIWEQTGSGLSHFMYVYQIELGILLGLFVIAILFFLYLYFANEDKQVQEEKDEND